MRAPIAIALGASLALSATAATAAAPASGVKAPIAAARLGGEFVLAGRVTIATAVRGEHVGETVGRKWIFTPLCRSGACATLVLVRNRARGTDRLRLHRRGPGRYSGDGSFYAPLQCGTRIYPRGELVPFTIDVTVTLALRIDGRDLATRISGSYTNRARTNLTPCFALLGHDAATYHGHIAAAPPAPAALSGRSPAGS